MTETYKNNNYIDDVAPAMGELFALLTNFGFSRGNPKFDANLDDVILSILKSKLGTYPIQDCNSSPQNSEPCRI